VLNGYERKREDNVSEKLIHRRRDALLLALQPGKCQERSPQIPRNTERETNPSSVPNEGQDLLVKGSLLGQELEDFLRTPDEFDVKTRTEEFLT
jgi:hypothetical protein